MSRKSNGAVADAPPEVARGQNRPPHASAATSLKLKRLKELGNAAGPTMYERVGLADELLSDRDFVVAYHQGNDRAAEESIEENYFQDVGGLVPLAQLLAVFREVERETWERHRFNLRRLVYELEDRRRAARQAEAGAPAPKRAEEEEKKPARRTATVRELEEAEKKAEDATRKLNAVLDGSRGPAYCHAPDDRVRELEEELATTKARLKVSEDRARRLEIENAELRGRLSARTQVA